MTELDGSLDLLKLRNACVATLGNQTKKRCVVIPIDDNDLYVKCEDGSTKPRSVYLGVSLWERNQASQYGHTHYAKQSFSKAFRENPDNKELLDNAPFLGDFKPIVRTRAPQQFAAPQMEVSQGGQDDLPF